MMVAFVLGYEDKERDEKERETNGLEKSLSPNAIVLAVFVVFASVGLVVVEVLEEFRYGLTDYDEDDRDSDRWPVVWFPVRSFGLVHACG